MNLLELFAGTKSVGKEAIKLGFNVFSSDFLPEFNTDYCVDILNFDVTKVPFKPDVIWSSPPCQSFSVSCIGRNWNYDGIIHTPKNESTKLGIRLVEKTIEIINYFKPKYWFIENPMGILRKLNLIEKIPDFIERHLVSYCQYGDRRKKPTDIWTNNKSWVSKPSCKNGAPCHEAAPRGSRTGTQGLKDAKERAVIPPMLCKEILESCLKN